MTAERPRSGLTALPDLERDILVAVNDNPGFTSEKIAGAISLSLTATRQHLTRLEIDGLIEHTTVRRQARGRPVHMFRLTRAGYDLFPKNHLYLLLAVLEVLERDHPEVLDQVFQRLHEQFIAPEMDLERLLASAPAERAAELLTWISRYGHRLVYQAAESGGSVEVTYCPALDVARRHPGICQSECRWLAAAFPEFEVRLDETIATGAPRCRFTLGPRQPSLP